MKARPIGIDLVEVNIKKKDETYNTSREDREAAKKNHVKSAIFRKHSVV